MFRFRLLEGERQGIDELAQQLLHGRLRERAGLQCPVPDRVTPRIMDHLAQFGGRGGVDVEVEVQCSHERSPVRSCVAYLIVWIRRHWNRNVTTAMGFTVPDGARESA